MKPQQFNFSREWNSAIKLIRGRPKVVSGMDELAKHWFELAEFKRDEIKEYDSIQADAEFQLDLMTFAIKHWDLHWLRNWSHGTSDIVVNLVLGIAETLYPNQRWQIIDVCDYQIVTNKGRTMVFDFHNFDKLPAGASLKLAQDKKYQPNKEELQAAIDYLEHETSISRAIAQKMQEHIEYFDSSEVNNVVSLPNGSAYKP